MSATTPLPTEEQRQRAKWDLLLTDLELRSEQLRQMKRYEPWRLAAAIVGAGAGLLAAGAAIGVLLARL